MKMAKKAKKRVRRDEKFYEAIYQGYKMGISPIQLSEELKASRQNVASTASYMRKLGIPMPKQVNSIQRWRKSRGL